MNYGTISPQSCALEEAAAGDASAIAAPTTNGVLNINGITNGVNGGYELRPLGKVNGVAPASPASTAVCWRPL